MTILKSVRTLLLVAASCCLALPLFAQSDRDVAAQLAELAGLKDRINSADTRTRVDAFHRAWSIALASDNSDVKTSAIKVSAISLMTGPVASASDHIRMPAVYAIAGIANSSSDPKVKIAAVDALREPIVAAQLPIRDAAIDAMNSIVRETDSGDVVLEAIRLLGEPVRSGNNGVRIPAVNALMQAAEHTDSEAAKMQALDLLSAPLESQAMIGGMEVRMMAVVAAERIGVSAREVATKAKAMGMMQQYANKGGWEPEARKRAGEAVAAIEHSMNDAKKPVRSQSSTHEKIS